MTNEQLFLGEDPAVAIDKMSSLTFNNWNPAVQFCVDHGGKPEANGTMVLCRFPNGSACEIWNYAKGDCAPTELKPIVTFGDVAGPILAATAVAGVATAVIYLIVRKR